MRDRDRAWDAALAEHAAEVQACAAAIARVPGAAWQHPRAPGKWSPAALVLHVTRAYELGAAAIARGEPGMRLRVPRLAAFVARTVLLQRLLATRRFPRGAEAPGEVVPDAAEAARSTPADASRRLVTAADEAARVLRRAARMPRPPRFVHAYFGALPPLDVLRLLSAHTRHHAAQLPGAAAR